MKNVQIYKEFNLLLPEGQLGNWDVFDYWEQERFESMRKNLLPASIMYDIGTEHGWLAALYAKTLNIDMVLVEPTAEFWPSIKAIFESNGAPMPLANYVGFASSVSNDRLAQKLHIDHWPEEANGELLREGMPYRYLHNDSDLSAIPTTTIDEIYIQTGIKPDALNIDVEGAELEVLRGAAGVLDEIRPLVWLSVHPDLMQRDYHTDPEEITSFMDQWGYTGELLAIDHEHHYLYSPHVL